MVERIHKDLYGTGGKDKFHIDEISDEHGNTLSLLLESIINDSKVERGSNSNGNYLKSPSGLVVCYATTPSQLGSHTWNYPVEFLSNPIVLALPTHDTTVWQSSKATDHIVYGVGRSTYLNMFAIGEGV